MTTYCGTEETDIEKIDDTLTIGSYQQYLEVKDKLLIKEN